MKEFKIVQEQTLTKLAIKIERAINNDWQLHGTVTPVTGKGYFQAIHKTYMVWDGELGEYVEANKNQIFI